MCMKNSIAATIDGTVDVIFLGICSIDDYGCLNKISNNCIRGIKHDFPFINICKVPRDLANVNE